MTSLRHEHVDFQHEKYLKVPLIKKNHKIILKKTLKNLWFHISVSKSSSKHHFLVVMENFTISNFRL